MKKIQLKPHHLLDIIKLYGDGIEFFQPDKKYNHDFYLIGNQVLKNSNTLVKLVLGCDDICKPCVFNINCKCRDIVAGTLKSKEDHNRQIDSKLLSFLHFTEGDVMTVLSYCIAVNDSLNEVKLREVWKDEPDEKFKQRIASLQKGLAKYIAQNNYPPGHFFRSG